MPRLFDQVTPRFNTQPPEGGWKTREMRISQHFGFNTQPPEGGWIHLYAHHEPTARFNTQPPEGGWHIRAHYRACRALFQHTAA